MNKYQSSTAEHLELRRMLLSFKVQVVVPFGVSLVTGAGVGVGVAVFLRIVDIPAHTQYGLVVGALTFVVSWIFYTLWLRSQWKLLNEQQGASKLPRSVTRFEQTSKTSGGHVVTIHEFAFATPAQVATLADMIAGGNSITVPLLERVLGGRIAANGFLNDAIEKGFLRWRNPDSHKQGIDYTEKGRALFSGIARNHTLLRSYVSTQNMQAYRPTHREHTQNRDDDEG